MQVLLRKQVQSSQFRSQGERDAHLQKEQKTLQGTAKQIAATQARLQQQIQQLNDELNELASVSKEYSNNPKILII
jgi:peptidoglycan hydrolase CwlO-like protein